MNNLITLILFSLVILSCGSDPDCGENGRAISGGCACDAFYEGESCELEINAKYLGIWKAKKTCVLSTNFLPVQDFEISLRSIDTIVIESRALLCSYPVLGKIDGSEDVAIPVFQPDFKSVFDAKMEYVGPDSLHLNVDDLLDNFIGYPCQYVLTRD